jgi:hypothetical protein
MSPFPRPFVTGAPLSLNGVIPSDSEPMNGHPTGVVSATWLSFS